LKEKYSEMEQNYINRLKAEKINNNETLNE